MSKAMKELRDVKPADVPNRVQELRKEYIILQAQVATGTPPKNPMQMKNIRKTIARLLTVLKQQAPASVAHRKQEKPSQPIQTEISKNSTDKKTSGEDINKK